MFCNELRLLQFSCIAETNLERGGKKLGAWSIETNLEHVRNKSRTRSKQIWNTVETNLDQGRNKIEYGCNNFEYGRNKSGAGSRKISSLVETNLEHDGNNSRA